jgi:hypothetical protein
MVSILLSMLHIEKRRVCQKFARIKHVPGWASATTLFLPLSSQPPRLQMHAHLLSESWRVVLCVTAQVGVGKGGIMVEKKNHRCYSLYFRA